MLKLKRRKKNHGCRTVPTFEIETELKKKREEMATNVLKDVTTVGGNRDFPELPVTRQKIKLELKNKN